MRYSGRGAARLRTEQEEPHRTAQDHTGPHRTTQDRTGQLLLAEEQCARQHPPGHTRDTNRRHSENHQLPVVWNNAFSTVCPLFFSTKAPCSLLLLTLTTACSWVQQGHDKSLLLLLQEHNHINQVLSRWLFMNSRSSLPTPPSASKPDERTRAFGRYAIASYHRDMKKNKYGTDVCWSESINKLEKRAEVLSWTPLLCPSCPEDHQIERGWHLFCTCTEAPRLAKVCQTCRQES